MKCIIAGSRTIRDYEVVSEAIRESKYRITTVISGTAPGVDRLGERWAKDHGTMLVKFPADWNRFGRSAGPIRNAEMAKEADCAVVVWDGASVGSKDMVEQMKRVGKPCFVYVYTAHLAEIKELPSRGSMLDIGVIDL